MIDLTNNNTLGHITVVDHDIVEVSNLHRQVLHTQDSLGMPKALSAKRALEAYGLNRKYVRTTADGLADLQSQLFGGY